MIMIVKTPGSQMGSPAAAEEGGEEVGGGRHGQSLFFWRDLYSFSSHVTKKEGNPCGNRKQEQKNTETAPVSISF